jgi:hypothetical protein
MVKRAHILHILTQGKYAVEILRRFKMEDRKMMATPMVTDLKKVVTSDSEFVDLKIYRKLIGSLMYSVNSRTNICFVVNTLSQFMVEPRQVHWIEAKHVPKYLRGTVEYGLRYLGGDGVTLQGYSYSNWAGSAVERKSLYWYSHCICNIYVDTNHWIHQASAHTLKWKIT